MEMTRKEYDALVASGRITDVAPAKETPSVTAKDETSSSLSKQVNMDKPKEETTGYSLPVPQALGRALTKEEKKYLLETRRGLKKIRNPNYARKASAITRSGARIEDIDGGVAYYASLDAAEQEEKAYAKEERRAARKAKVVELQLTQKQTRDRSKIGQNIVKGYSDLAIASDFLGTLMDNYDSTNVGQVDGLTNRAANFVGWGDTRKRKAHMSAMAGIETALKKAAGFGANYSEYEQKLMKDMIPSDWTSEESYKSGVYSTARNLKKILQNKIDAQGLAGYETGGLKKMILKMDKIIERADKFSGGRAKKDKSNKGDYVAYTPKAKNETPAVQAEKKHTPSAVKFDGSNVADLDAMLGL